MSNKLDACLIDNVHVYRVDVFNPHINYEVIIPSVTAEVGYRMGERAMGSNKFEGLGTERSENPHDERIRDLSIQLIKAIEDRVIDVLSGKTTHPIEGILTEEI
jgi:hypothetical protein